MKKSLKLVAGALFIFALLFNSSLTNNDGEVSLSLTALQMAQAQDGEDDYCEPCEDEDGFWWWQDEYGDECGAYIEYELEYYVCGWDNSIIGPLGGEAIYCSRWVEVYNGCD